MVRLYGGCIEPGGMELDDEDYAYEGPCPDCGKQAHHRCWEQLDCGCINPYHTIDCPHCGHSSGYDFLPPF